MSDLYHPKEKVSYWLHEIEEKGANAVREKLPYMNGAKKEAAEQALAQDQEDRANRALERAEQRESEALELSAEANRIASEANSIAIGARKWAGWSIAIALLSALVSALALSLNSD